eukprot:scaffold3799_cov168-Ochromonas_danica.AAC.1
MLPRQSLCVLKSVAIVRRMVRMVARNQSMFHGWHYRGLSFDESENVNENEMSRIVKEKNCART